MSYSLAFSILGAYFGGIILLAAVWRKVSNHQPPPKGGIRAQESKITFAEFHASRSPRTIDRGAAAATTYAQRRTA